MTPFCWHKWSKWSMPSKANVINHGLIIGTTIIKKRACLKCLTIQKKEIPNDY